MIRNKKLEISSQIVDEVKKNILENNLIQDGEKIVVAVSGGPDSMCLLEVLKYLQSVLKDTNKSSYDLVVAHVNHGIREESNQEKIYVEKKCNELDIPFFYLKEDVELLAKEKRMYVQACGRMVRYNFFDKVKKETHASKIAVAHNLDDNVETILLNIIRGCGLSGLIGMKFSTNDIIRPLLTIEKKYILEYNSYCDLNPCFDITNTQNIYLRNKIRNTLIPCIKKEYNDNFVNNIIRMKDTLKNDENFLDEYTNNIITKSFIKSDKNMLYFKTSTVIDLHIAISYRYIRKVIEMKLGNLDGISNIHILDIYDLLKKNINGKKYIFGNKFTIEILKNDMFVIY